MKKFILIIFLLPLTVTSHAQTLVFVWDTSIVVNDNIAFGIQRPKITLLEGEVPAITWGNLSNESAYFSKLVGGTFTAPVQVNTPGVPVFIQNFAGPNIAAKGDSIFISYDQYSPPSTGRIYLHSSFDGGLTWSDTMRASSYSPNTLARFGTVGIKNGQEVFITYLQSDTLGLSPEYMLGRSTNGGNTFSTALVATTGSLEPCDCCFPGIAVEGDRVAVVYRNNDNNIREIYAALSTDGGVSIDTVMDIDPSQWVVANCPQTGPDAYFSGDSLYATWMSAATSPSRVMAATMSAFTDSSEAGFGRLVGPNEPGNQNYPSITGNGDVVIVVYERPDSVGTRVAMAWSGTGLANLSDPSVPFEHGSASQRKPDVIFSNTTLHLVFQDSDNDRIIYMRGNVLNALSAEDGNYAGPLEIYPNPANDFTQVHAPFARNGKLAVWSLSGQKLFESPMESTTQNLDTHALSSGTYFITVSDGKGIWAGKLRVE